MKFIIGENPTTGWKVLDDEGEDITSKMRVTAASVSIGGRQWDLTQVRLRMYAEVEHDVPMGSLVVCRVEEIEKAGIEAQPLKDWLAGRVPD